jgi:hypothetical protein
VVARRAGGLARHARAVEEAELASSPERYHFFLVPFVNEWTP